MTKASANTTSDIVCTRSIHSRAVQMHFMDAWKVKCRSVAIVDVPLVIKGTVAAETEE